MSTIAFQAPVACSRSRPQTASLSTPPPPRRCLLAAAAAPRRLHAASRTRPTWLPPAPTLLPPLEAGQATAAELAATFEQAPMLPKRWDKMTAEQRLAYLEAVRDFYGEGEVVRHTTSRGTVHTALIDPRVKPLWEIGKWTAGPDGAFVSTVPVGPGQDTGLHRLTVRLTFFDGEAPSFYYDLRVQYRDGCPANCLPCNLHIKMPANFRKEWIAELAKRHASNPHLHRLHTAHCSEVAAQAAASLAAAAAELEAAGMTRGDAANLLGKVSVGALEQLWSG